MRLDEGMPATLVVGNQELGCFVKNVQGESVREAGGARIFSRIDEVVVVPWRSPFATESESLDAIERILDKTGASREFYESLDEMRRGAESARGCGEAAE